MSDTNSLTENQWFHRCQPCSNCFSYAKLDSSCPKCGNCNDRETISHNFYLNERYGTMTPEEWSTTLGIEDLTNPVDARDSDE